MSQPNTVPPAPVGRGPGKVVKLTTLIAGISQTPGMQNLRDPKCPTRYNLLGNVTKAGNVETVNINDLHVDRHYQRQPNLSLIKRMLTGRGFEEHAVMMPLVFRREDGRLFIVEGQQRCLMMGLRGCNEIDCIVIASLGLTHESKVFALINEDRRQVPAATKHKNNTLSDEDKPKVTQAKMLQKTVREVDCDIDEVKTSRTVQAPTELHKAARLLRKPGEKSTVNIGDDIKTVPGNYKIIKDALLAYRNAWPSANGIVGRVVAGMAVVLYASKRDDDRNPLPPGDLGRVLGAKFGTPEDYLETSSTKASVSSARGPAVVIGHARFMLDEYRKTRTKKGMTKGTKSLKASLIDDLLPYLNL